MGVLETAKCWLHVCKNKSNDATTGQSDGIIRYSLVRSLGESGKGGQIKQICLLYANNIYEEAYMLQFSFENGRYSPNCWRTLSILSLVCDKTLPEPCRGNVPRIDSTITLIVSYRHFNRCGLTKSSGSLYPPSTPNDSHDTHTHTHVQHVRVQRKLFITSFIWASVRAGSAGNPTFSASTRQSQAKHDFLTQC